MIILGTILILLLLIIVRAASKDSEHSPVLSSAKLKEMVGERYVSNLLSQLSDEYIIYNDIMFRTGNGTTQIDHLVFSKYGIFAIETKNYTGEIYGDDTRQQWTQIISNDVIYHRKWWKMYRHVTKNYFYNPVKQARGHAFRIRELLKGYPNLKIIPIVAFVGDSDLSNINSNCHVVTGQQLVPLITGYKNICISNQEFVSIYNILNSYNVRQIVDDETHVNNIKRVEQDYESKIQSGICPKCGGHLTLKTGKYGSFYGCSNYPKCKFTAKQQESCPHSYSNTSLTFRY